MDVRRLLTVALVTLVVGSASLYVLVTAGLYTFQDAILFPAPAVSRAALDEAAAQNGARPIELVASDGVKLYGWHVPGDGTRALIYFHGNGAHAGGAGWFGQQLPGVDVVCISYRGYPGSQGSPSEAGFELDARAVWAFVTLTLGVPADRVIVQGQSMGGGVAHLLLDEVTPAGVVFDSTFTSVEEIASGQYPWLPVSLLLKNPFRSWERSPKITVPALVMHGSDDHLIPVEHGRRLAKLLPSATYVEIPGWGHDRWLLDHPDAHRAWRAFLHRAWATNP